MANCDHNQIEVATFCAGDEPLHSRHELERLGIENPELLLHADGEGRAEVLLDHSARTPWTGPPAASHA